MTKVELFYLAEQMKEILGEETFIHDLMDSMDSIELEENLKHISRSRDLDLFDD